MRAGIDDTRHRYPWSDADERFLIAAKRKRFAEKDIAFLLKRSTYSVHEKARKLKESGVLLCHREEELDLLERLLAEAQEPEVLGEEVE